MTRGTVWKDRQCVAQDMTTTHAQVKTNTNILYMDNSFSSHVDTLAGQYDQEGVHTIGHWMQESETEMGRYSSMDQE
jgi:hypothetical protein